MRRTEITPSLISSIGRKDSAVARFFKAPVGGIPAWAGVLGKATCDYLKLTAAETLVDSGDDMVVYNWGVTAACVTGKRIGVAVLIDSKWVFIAQDCSDEGLGSTPIMMITSINNTPETSDPAGLSESSYLATYVGLSSVDLINTLPSVIDGGTA